MLEGLRGEESIAELWRREGITTNLYYSWSKDSLEADKKRLALHTTREATSDEVKVPCPTGTKAVVGQLKDQHSSEP